MENPATWDRLTSSLAVCDLQMPDKVWAFLVLQGLVRDLPGDRDFFYGIIQQEKSIGEITGPSLQSRISGRLKEFGIALAISTEPDPNAESAKKRLESLNELMKSKESFSAVRQSFYCTNCGVEVDKQKHPLVCPACQRPFQDVSTTCVKPCQACKTLNPAMAIFCYRCGRSTFAENIIFSSATAPLTQEDYLRHCASCGFKQQPGLRYCKRCGANATYDYRATNAHVTDMTNQGRITITAGMPPHTEYWQTRLFRLFNKAEDSQFSEDILFVLISAMQDIFVMKELLKEKGVWDEASYKKLRLERMISDHSSAGATPWKTYSYFPYTLEEEEFLKQVFAASKEEIEKFKEEVESISELS